MPVQSECLHTHQAATMSIRDALRIPAHEITDETVYRERRRLLQALALGPALGLAGCAEAEPRRRPR